MTALSSAGMIAARVMELRRRRGLMIALIAMNIGFPALFLLIRLLAHALAPRANPPAGGDQIFVILAAGFLPTLSFIVATMVGCTAGSRDLAEGMFRHLVVTGRSRVALYLARIPAGLAIVVPLAAVGYMIVCAVCVVAAPSFIDDGNANIPPGLSLAGFEHWAGEHAVPVICSLPYTGPAPSGVPCNGPPGWSKSALTPAHQAPAAVEALAVRIASHDYSGPNGYTAIRRYPPVALMAEGGLWIELEAATAFVIGLGLASLMGQRTVPVVLLIMLQLILTPILASVDLPHLQGLEHSVVGVAVSRLEPSGLPTAIGVPGVAGGIRGSGSGRAQPAGPAAEAGVVIIAWLAAWTILGAWRMRTRDA